MEGSVLSFFKAEWKVSDPGSAHWASSSFYFFVTEIEICLFQPFPLYQISTMWQQVVPKLNAKGRDLLQVSFKFTY